MNNVIPLRGIQSAPQPQDINGKLFMKPKDFSQSYGAPYCRVMDWIHQGMPVVPESRSPYLIIVPLALEWLGRR